MKLVIFRISTNDDVGTFGVLKWVEDPAPFAVSLEDPWKDNQKYISCIPVGHYICEPFLSPTHGPTFQVQNVPDRTYILFHKGNTHINTQGCVLVGEQFEFLDGVPSIAASRKGFDEFWARAKGQEDFELEIRWS